jgi:ABC-2 type transport system ATP-binding protein
VPVVEADGVVRRFGSVTALAGVTCTVERGVTGLVGANGAGKTTFLSVLLGLARPDAGGVSVLGLDPQHAGPEVRAIVGYSPEHRNLPPDVRAYDLVAHLAEIHGLPNRAARQRASDALYLVGLGEERFRAIGTMSTGQNQRVKLAAALAHDPRLVLLDEPTDGLDPVQRDDMLGLIRKVGTELGIDVLLSSHLLDEVERVCDSAIVMAEGQVVAAGPLDELRAGVGGWIVEVDDRADALAAAAHDGGLTVRRDGRALVLEGLSDPSTIRDLVAGLGIGLVRLQRRRLSLEDVLLGSGVYGGIDAAGPMAAPPPAGLSAPAWEPPTEGSQNGGPRR